MNLVASSKKYQYSHVICHLGIQNAGWGWGTFAIDFPRHGEVSRTEINYKGKGKDGSVLVSRRQRWKKIHL